MKKKTLKVWVQELAASEARNTYKVKWSPLIKTMTIILTVLFTYIEFTLIYNVANNCYTFGIAMPILFNLILFILIINIPTSITLDTSGITLKKLYGRIYIRYDQIKVIKSFKPIADIRVFGSGGFCGYIGIFSNDEYGWYNSYVGNPKQSFIIMTNAKKVYAFSCENSDIVVETIKKNML